MVRTLLVSSIVVAALAAPAGQAPQDSNQQGPTFRTGVDLITVDVAVVDGRGRPVEDLRAADFSVKINGEVRRVVTADLVKVDLDQAKRQAPDPTEAYFTSNISQATGRQILIAVDQLHINPAAIKPIMNAASQFLNLLTPLDQVAFIAFPEPGPRANFTSDKTRVRRAMQGIVGQTTMRTNRLNIGVSEALALAAKSDQLVLATVRARVCDGALPEQCGRDIMDEAITIARRVREDTQISLDGLQSILRALAFFEGHKSVILISQSLAISDQTELDTVIRLAGAARASINVLAVDLSRDDVTVNEVAPTAMADRRIQLEGLEQLAAASRGTLYRVVGTGAGIFDRLASELSAHYVLGVEQRPSDVKRDRHRVDIQVRRRDVTIRSGQAFVLSPTLTARRSVEETLRDVLSSPIALSGLPLRVATFAQRDKGDKVRITLAAQIGQPGTPPGEFTVGYAVVNNENRIVGSSMSRVQLASGAGSPNEPLHYGTAMILDPGVYSLRVAVVDGEGRRGGVARDLSVFKVAGEEFATSDLIVGNMPKAGVGMRPSVEPHINTDRLAAYLELYSTTPDRLAATTVEFEVAREEASEALATRPAQIEDGASGRVAVGVVDASPLPPGRYIVRAKMARDGKTIGVLARPFVLERAEAAVAPDPAPK